MEIKLDGKEAIVLVAGVVAEFAVMIAALTKLRKETKRANVAEFKSWFRGCDIAYKDHQIRELNKKIEKMRRW